MATAPFAADLAILPPVTPNWQGLRRGISYWPKLLWQDARKICTREVKWTSSNPAFAKVDATGLVTPLADGAVTITATSPSGTAHATVRVSHMKTPFVWSFRNDVIPVLTKAGCNQGACHGALAGKNGFKLTLRGYDPDVDYDTLTRQSIGRRINLSDPAAQPDADEAVDAHSARRRHSRLEPKSLEYRVIAEWIAVRNAASRRFRPANHRARSVSRGRDAQSRAQSSSSWSRREIFGRQGSGRDALGEVLLER